MYVGIAKKDALSSVLELITRVNGLFEDPLDQPLKVKPELAVAVIVT